jgi:hypothetical protein
MPLITAVEMSNRGLVPFVVLDANGMHTRDHITAFDAETGEVESLVMNADGSYVMDGDEVKRRQEFYPAPLLWWKGRRRP